MYTLINYCHKVALAAVVVLLAGCGSDTNNDTDEERALGQDTAFLFVERSITSDAAENLQHFHQALQSANHAPQDLNSPYVYNPGAQLLHRSSLSPDAQQWEVLSAYMGTSEYDVKDLTVSPDGKRVLFAARGPDDHPSDYTWNIYEYDFSNREVRRLIADDNLANDGEDTNPTYAADGRIVFSSDRAAGNPRLPGPDRPDDPDEDCYKIGPAESPSLLHIMSAQGEDILQLTFGSNHDTETTTLADGKIAFLRWSRSYDLLPYCDTDDMPVNGASRRDFFPSGYPNGLSSPGQWDQARLCSFSISTPLGQALPSNHYTLLAIDPDSGVIEQLYETVTIHGSDEEFVYLDDLVQGQDGHLIGLMKHFYNEHRGGNVVRLEDPVSPRRGSIFANAAPRSLVTDDINLYPNQLSPKGWYSAVAPYRDGTSRLLVSWSQCTTQRNGVNAFCAQGGQGQVSSEYGIWVYDPRNDSRLPVVQARRDKVYTELALAQNQPALGLPFAPINPEFEDNLDESRLICDDPSPIDPTDPDPNPNPDPDPNPNPDPDPNPNPDPDPNPNPDPDPNPNPDPNPDPDPNPNPDPDPNPNPDPDPNPNPDPDPNPNPDPEPGNTPPVAIAGPDEYVKAGQVVTLDGSDSYDDDRDQLTYRWRLVDWSPGSTVTQESIIGGDTPNPSFIPDKAVQIPVQVDFVFIIDGSASMRDEIEQVRNGLRAFVENISDPSRLVDARFAMLTFEERPRGTFMPDVRLPFTTDVEAVLEAFDNIDTSRVDGGQQREAGLEAIRYVLGDPELDGSPLPELEFRANARKSLILATDEDSDGPVGGNGYPSSDQDEIDRTARKVVENRAFLDLLIEPGHRESRQQYGDPDSDQLQDDGNRFDADATLAALRRNGYGQSLQAQVLEAGLVARSYHVLRANDPIFVDSFFTSKVEESFEDSVLGRYTLGLVVHDGQEASSESLVTIRAFTDNVPPNARAGRDQTARVDRMVNLDGSGSFDRDGPTALSYRWQFISRPDGSTARILNPDQVEASFVPDRVGTYIVELELNDGATDGTHRGTDSVIIRVFEENAPPNADAGEYPAPMACTSIALNGGASFDPENQALVYRWSFVSLPEGSELRSESIPNGANSSFTPDRDGSYVLRLDVSDGENNSWDNALIVVEGCSP